MEFTIIILQVLNILFSLVRYGTFAMTGILAKGPYEHYLIGRTFKCLSPELNKDYYGEDLRVNTDKEHVGAVLPYVHPVTL